MRIKKISILEAAANAVVNTSNTTDVNQQNDKSKLVKPEDIEKSKKALEDLDKKVAKTNKDIKDGPMGAFLKGDGLSENNHPGTGEDFGDLGSSDIENLADRDDRNREDYNDWLNSPEGQDYMTKLGSIDESVKNKRKVIKTIKVKDLK
jgi:hypothetical protein